MKNAFIFLFCLLFARQASAQNDTILVGYSADDSGASFLNELAVFSHHKYGISQRTTNGYKVFVSGPDGQALYARPLDQVANFSIQSCSWMLEDETRYVYIGNALRGNQSFLIVFSLDTTLSEIQLIDTLALNGAEQLFFEVLKYNTAQSVWEGFGMVQMQGGGAITGVHYIALNDDFQVVKSRRLQGDYHPNPVLEFQWMDDIGRYFLSLFGGRNLLVDAEQQLLRESPDVTQTYLSNNIQYTTALRVYNCFSSEGSRLYAYAKSFSDGPYNVAMVTLELAGDSVRLIEAIPLNEPSLGLTFASKMLLDREGNYVVSGVNALSAPLPNKISVVKFSPELETLWTFHYESDKSFIIWDMEADENNDLVIVGQAWNIFGDGQPRGFLMKVYANGALVSYQEAPAPESLRLFPNPATRQFVVQSEAAIRQIRLTDLSGRLVYETIPGAVQTVQVIVPKGLSRGIYTVEAIFTDGRKTTRKVALH
jgi:hypothetical protein